MNLLVSTESQKQFTKLGFFVFLTNIFFFLESCRCTSIQQAEHASNKGCRQRLAIEVFSGSNCDYFENNS